MLYWEKDLSFWILDLFICFVVIKDMLLMGGGLWMMVDGNILLIFVIEVVKGVLLFRRNMLEFVVVCI